MQPQVMGRSGREVFLDADWGQPFVVGEGAGSTTVFLSEGGTLSPLGVDEKEIAEGDASGQRLYPFKLSYVPLQPRPGDHPVLAPRRTVRMATTTPGARRRWVEEFSQKARAPELRASAPAVRLFNHAVASSMSPNRRHFAALGKRHATLPALGPRASRPPSMSQASSRKLAFGHSRLFESSSPLRVVRDLYDGYASDPLTESERGKYATGSLVVISHEKHTKFLKKYMDRQAAIEQLLEQRWTGATGSLTPLRGMGGSAHELPPFAGAALDGA